MIFMYTLCPSYDLVPLASGLALFYNVCNGHLLVVYIECITCVICCLRKSEFLAVIFFVHPSNC